MFSLVLFLCLLSPLSVFGDCIAYWQCTASATPSYPTQCSGNAPSVYDGPGTPVPGKGGSSQAYLVHSTLSNQPYTFVPSSSNCVEVLLFGCCSPTTVSIRTDEKVVYNCAGGDPQCSATTPTPASSVTYQVDISPASGETCQSCASLAQSCSVPENPLGVDPQFACGPKPACTTGTDPFTGSPYVVCQSSPTTMWISGNEGKYHAQYICNLYGYPQVLQIGGTCAITCGYCNNGFGSTSCSSLGSETFDGEGNCGSDAHGIILCYTVQWQCGF